eukprot:8161469-Alexandrium_andersonii.AAC.1
MPVPHTSPATRVPAVPRARTPRWMPIPLFPKVCLLPRRYLGRPCRGTAFPRCSCASAVPSWFPAACRSRAARGPR